MSRSHKDRHTWKRKERQRSGQGDPAKIRLHRQRFLGALEHREKRALAPPQAGQYSAIALHASLLFEPDEQSSTIVLPGDKEIGVPFLVMDPADCHYALAQEKPDFSAANEQKVLDAHVQKAKFQGHACRLEVRVDGVFLCSSIMPCQFRKWDAERGQALCALNR